MKFTLICFFLFGLLFVFRATGQEKNSSTGFEVLVCGRITDHAYRDAENIVADRWNIHLKSIASCMGPSFSKDSAEAFNRRSDSLISLKYGKPWRREFDREIAKEKKLIEKFVSRIKTLDRVSHLDSMLAGENNEVYYMVYPYSLSRKEKKYEVFVYGWGIIDGKTDIVCYYKFKLYRNKKTIELVTDKTSFLFN